MITSRSRPNHDDDQACDQGRELERNGREEKKGGGSHHRSPPPLLHRGLRERLSDLLFFIPFSMWVRSSASFTSTGTSTSTNIMGMRKHHIITVHGLASVNRDLRNVGCGVRMKLLQRCRNIFQQPACSFVRYSIFISFYFFFGSQLWRPNDRPCVQLLLQQIGWAPFFFFMVP